MEHVGRAGGGQTADGCLFEPETDASWDRDRLLLHQDGETVVLLNRYPYANGHLLVAPRRHVAELHRLDRREGEALMAMLGHCTRILGQTLRPDGFNVGVNLGEVAGAGIPGHLHFQVVPRWAGDHNFITVLAEIRTIPQHLLTTFDILQPWFAALRGETDASDRHP